MQIFTAKNVDQLVVKFIRWHRFCDASFLSSSKKKWLVDNNFKNNEVNKLFLSQTDFVSHMEQIYYILKSNRPKCHLELRLRGYEQRITFEKHNVTSRVYAL